MRDGCQSVVVRDALANRRQLITRACKHLVESSAHHAAGSSGSSEHHDCETCVYLLERDEPLSDELQTSNDRALRAFPEDRAPLTRLATTLSGRCSLRRFASRPVSSGNARELAAQGSSRRERAPLRFWRSRGRLDPRTRLPSRGDRAAIALLSVAFVAPW
jgi:hypothetical protein